MPSNGSERDSEKNTQPKPYEEPNFFIRFKDKVDAHVGAVLQGVLGLPSAFSRPENSSDGTRSWKDLDDELKRRDELQARQQAMRKAAAAAPPSSTTAAVGTSQDDEEVSIPVKKYREYTEPPSTANPIASSKCRKDLVDGDVSIDLYAPLTKSFFQHLNLPQDSPEQKEWDTTSAANVFLFPMGSFSYLRKDQLQKSSEIPLNMMQYMTYNSLCDLSRSASSSFSKIVQFNNGKLTTTTPETKSLLPFLLFSPYSPLALTHLPPLPAAVRRERNNDSSPADEFTYCDAFEDLLLATQGRPMRTWESEKSGLMAAFVGQDVWPWSRLEKNSVDLWKTKSDVALAKANLGMSWIRESLGPNGLLTDSPFDFLFPFHLQSLDTPKNLFRVGFEPLFKSIVGRTDTRSGEDAETELDLYEYLKKFDDVLPIDEDSNELLSQVAAWKREREQEAEYLEMDGDKKADMQLSKSTTQHQQERTTMSSSSTQTDLPSASPSNNTKKVQIVHKQQHTPETSPEHGNVDENTNGGLVSTTTTTEHSVDKDGQRTTTVEVEKMFRDGRREVSRVVDVRPGRVTKGEEAMKVEEPTLEGDRNGREENKPREANKDKKKGWFWG